MHLLCLGFSMINDSTTSRGDQFSNIHQQSIIAVPTSPPISIQKLSYFILSPILFTSIPFKPLVLPKDTRFLSIISNSLWIQFYHLYIRKLLTVLNQLLQHFPKTSGSYDVFPLTLSKHYQRFSYTYQTSLQECTITLNVNLV